MTARPPSLRQLAADEVERLNAVGALVDHGDAGVAHELLHAPFVDIAVAAEHLLRLHGVLEAEVGEHALEHRRHQPEPIVRRLTRRGVFGAMRDVAVERGGERKAARRLVEGLDLHAACAARRDAR